MNSKHDQKCKVSGIYLYKDFTQIFKKIFVVQKSTKQRKPLNTFKTFLTIQNIENDSKV